MRDPQELFFALALDDVRRAADLLRPAYEASDGRDGFVSFECTPDLADDTEATVEQALELWDRLARPNVMIKVPATEAGVPAIEELTARGVNVNVTLLFSVARYEQVIDAYLAGLERRVRRGRAGRRDRLGGVVLRLARRRQGRRRAPGGLASCAAASRSPTPASPMPATATASPTTRWRRPARAGAHPQRPLWASTGTKDPAYSDVLYVEELIAPDVINTMPEATLRAFADHGRRHAHVRREPGDGDAPARRGRGHRSRRHHAALEREGVRSFCDSYRELLACIEAKLPAAGRLAERR